MRQKSIRQRHLSLQGWTAIGFILAILLLAMAPQHAYAQPPSPLNPESQSAGEVAKLFWLILWIAIAVFVLVEGLLLFAVIRYRRREDDEEPEQVHGNATLEIMWTVVPSIIMAVLFALTLQTLQAQRNVPDNVMQIQVTGQQWFWTFKYDNGVSTSREVYIPVGRPVEFLITSRDVIHSFWVPQLGGKIDAIPGRRTSTWFTAEEPGTYLGQCAEFCGLEHYAMLFDVHALPENEFAAWMDERVAAMGNVIGDNAEPPNMEELEPGDSAHGEELFNTLGCTSCHSLSTEKIIGPGLSGVGQRAATRRADEGYSAEQYLAQSVIQPCEFVAPGYACQMPSFGDQLTATDLADLVAFLLQQ